MRSAGDHVSTEPIAVFDQSCARISAPIAPPPARKAWLEALELMVAAPGRGARSWDTQVADRDEEERGEERPRTRCAGSEGTRPRAKRRLNAPDPAPVHGAA
jgi:hypothetical protein